MNGLRRDVEEVPEHIRVRQIGRCMALLGVDEIRELNKNILLFI